MLIAEVCISLGIADAAKTIFFLIKSLFVNEFKFNVEKKIFFASDKGKHAHSVKSTATARTVFLLHF